MSTPILKHGDVIFLEIPYLTNTRGVLDLAATREHAKTLIEAFRDRGILVGHWTAMTGLDETRIVAIVRD